LTGASVLIAAFSGRALAASARRAGFTPLVVDCFGDEDTRQLCAALIALPARVQTGFTPRALIEALDALAHGAAPAPIGLVLGSGFECNPRLVARLAARFRLLGTGAEAIRRAKHPATFFPLLDRLEISHPETRLEAPAEPTGWLMKRIGGSGGLHIVPCPAKPRRDPRRYFQRRLDGRPVSLAAVAHAGVLEIVGLSCQWTSPLARRPYRYGGAVSGPPDDDALAQSLAAKAEAAASLLDLVGLVSFDFLIRAGEAWLIEVNPRPGATLDILDTEDGWAFAAHIAAAMGSPLPARPNGRRNTARASAVVYADRGPLTMSAVDWPDWVADRPMGGSEVGERQPLMSVAAEADMRDDAERLCRERVELATNMLYGPRLGKEARQ